MLNKVPLKAKIIRQELFDKVGFPAFVHGEAYGEVAGRWYRVTYPRPLRNATPVAVARARAGTIIKRVIEKLPDVSIEPISRPPRTPFKRFKLYSKTEAEFIDAIYEGLPSWLEPIPAPLWGNWRNAFAQAGGRFLFWIQGFVMNPRANSIRDELNAAIKDLDKRRDTQAKYIIDAINTRIKAINVKINSQLEKVREALNVRLYDLFKMWGIPTDMAITPVHTRNETDTGFEFQSFGKTRIHYIAIGGRM